MYSNHISQSIFVCYIVYSNITISIFKDTDKTVRVECAFTADDQTVSFRPTGGGREDGGGISVT